MARLKNMSVDVTENGELKFTIHYNGNANKVSETFTFSQVKNIIIPRLTKFLDEDAQKLKEIAALKRNKKIIEERLTELGVPL